jgi:hypothetical protein
MKSLPVRTLAAAAFASVAFCQTTVTGTLTVDGKSHRVTNACAYEEPDHFDKNKLRLTAFLWTGGKLLAGACRDSSFDLMDRMRSTGAPYLRAELELPSLEFSNGVIGAGKAPMSFSISGNNPATSFAGAYKDGLLNGRFHTLRKLQIGDSPAIDLDVRIEALKAERDTPTTNELTGAAASQSPAAIAAVKFLTAMSTSDTKAIRAMIVEDERAAFDATLASADGKQMLAMMSTMAKGTLAVPVSSVATKGPLTIVKMEKKTDGGKETATFKLRQENGEYRITRKN